MVITSLTFVVAAIVSSSVAVNIFSLSQRLLKGVQLFKWPIPSYRLPSGNTLTTNSKVRTNKE